MSKNYSLQKGRENGAGRKKQQRGPKRLLDKFFGVNGGEIRLYFQEDIIVNQKSNKKNINYCDITGFPA